MKLQSTDSKDSRNLNSKFYDICSDSGLSRLSRLLKLLRLSRYIWYQRRRRKWAGEGLLRRLSSMWSSHSASSLLTAHLSHPYNLTLQVSREFQNVKFNNKESEVKFGFDLCWPPHLNIHLSEDYYLFVISWNINWDKSWSWWSSSAPCWPRHLIPTMWNCWVSSEHPLSEALQIPFEWSTWNALWVKHLKYQSDSKLNSMLSCIAWYPYLILVIFIWIDCSV